MQQNMMLRKERKMNEADVVRFLLEAKNGRLGLCQNNEPYVVPVLFVYDVESEALFVHSSKKGMKIEMMRTNPKVCFEIDEMSNIVFKKSPCNCTVIYRSVIVFGDVIFINNSMAKAKVLNMFLKKYADETNIVPVTSEMTNNTQIIMIKIVSKTGKENKVNRNSGVQIRSSEL
jgi:nitroimidazol reductase NimA-like FMN-containing flavoprotein (pyridoxamine 5'-phosphate oxidase superfamily)